MAQNDNAKLAAILAYLLVGIIWFFVDEQIKKDAFAKFHVKQAIVLAITSIGVSVFGAAIPFIGWFIILPIGSLAVLVLWVIGVLNAVNGNQNKLPVIGQFADKFSI